MNLVFYKVLQIHTDNYVYVATVIMDIIRNLFHFY